MFAPVGELVPVAMRALDRGGVLSIAGIYMSDIPSLHYERDLFYERTLTTTTANTRRDGEELLRLATTVPLRVTTVSYPFAEAARALADLAHDRLTGAAVLQIA
jgi:propanol-preferring alcohol dehydrogenase